MVVVVFVTRVIGKVIMSWVRVRIRVSVVVVVVFVTSVI